MMSNKQVSPEVLDEQVYSNDGMPYIKIILIALCMFCVGLLLNFSLQNNIKNKIAAALSAQPSCPIVYEDLNVQLLFPSIGLSKATLPGSCFQSRGSSIELDNIEFYLSGLSFYPFGLKFDGKALGEQLDFKSTLSLGLPRPFFKLHKSTIDMKLINALISRPGLLSGDLELEAQGQLDGPLIKQMNMLIQAKKLSLPAQTISGLRIPTLNFGQAAGKLRLSDHNELNLDEFVLGNENSPIVGKLNGQVRLNQNNINGSQLDLTAFLKFSPSFIESFPVLNFFLNNKEKNDEDFYKIQITGLLGSPNVQ